MGILIDRGCGSACEQFLLEARASAKVMLFGAPSNGALDYSNLVPHALPSGRLLWLPITRSRRLPEQPVDGIGVTPDVPLAPELFGGPQREHVLEWVVSVLENPALAGTPPRWEP